jgi:hypothetical protein
VLRITTGGVPVPVGKPVSSGGIKPVSVAVSPSELAAADASAAERYPGIAAHLRACGPCGEDFDGLLAAVRGAAG